eukprot:GHVU01108963.1.p1 GENE.GHVU01108963.1~~GHVU01108963.1.p1  ORF type:complete len:226 (-),score=51.22 GHVU01108963.1:147-824(-)
MGDLPTMAIARKRERVCKQSLHSLRGSTWKERWLQLEGCLLKYYSTESSLAPKEVVSLRRAVVEGLFTPDVNMQNSGWELHSFTIRWSRISPTQAATTTAASASAASAGSAAAGGGGGTAAGGGGGPFPLHSSSGGGPASSASLTATATAQQQQQQSMGGGATPSGAASGGSHHHQSFHHSQSSMLPGGAGGGPHHSAAAPSDDTWGFLHFGFQELAAAQKWFDL